MDFNLWPTIFSTFVILKLYFLLFLVSYHSGAKISKRVFVKFISQYCPLIINRQGKNLKIQGFEPLTAGESEKIKWIVYSYAAVISFDFASQLTMTGICSNG